MDRQTMIDHLKHEQKNLMFWIGHSQKVKLPKRAGSLGLALTMTANMLRKLRTEDVSVFDFLLLCDQNDEALHAYWDDVHEREHSDRIWNAYMRLRAWIHEMQRKGMVERDSDGNYDLTDAGRDYFNTGRAA